MVADYACRKCGTLLFNGKELGHAEAGGETAGNVKTPWARAARKGGRASCTSVFTQDAPTWAAEAVNENAGPLSCPSCQARVGNYSWSGSACSCGRWIAPSFQFPLAKVDPKRTLNVTAIARAPPARSAPGPVSRT